MRATVGDVSIHFSEHGPSDPAPRGAVRGTGSDSGSDTVTDTVSGTGSDQPRDRMPLVALHGAGVDHREIEGALEAILPHAGLRRIYPDLPGMGETAANGLDSNDDVVDLLAAFIRQQGAGPVLLVGHSYGGYLARGIAGRHPDAVAGLALLAPVVDGSEAPPAQRAVRENDDARDELEPDQREGFEGYFVVRTRETARRYRERVAPGIDLVDHGALERLFGGWTVNVGNVPFPGPTLIVAARHDSTVGVAGPESLLGAYPDAELAVIEEAGHALVHEQPELLGAVLGEWIDRVRRSDR